LQVPDTAIQTVGSWSRTDGWRSVKPTIGFSSGDREISFPEQKNIF
jgi:hypothetical protein